MPNTKTKCPLYNKGLYIEKINQTDAHVSMCCFQTLSTSAYTAINFENNEYLHNIRSKLTDPIECNVCTRLEKVGHQSYRIGQQRAFELLNLSIDNTVELLSFSYNCENTCNLKCITCGPKFSSMWRSDHERLGYSIPKIKKTSGHRNRIYENLDLTKVRLLHFQGGEPLLTDDHENIMEKIGDLSNVIVSYNTNATIFPKATTLNLWKKTQLTKLYFSIDAVGDQFEYIRFPGKWKQVTDNMNRIRNLDIPNIWIEIGITVGINNLFYLQDIIDWRNLHFAKLNNGDPINMYINFVGDISHGGELLRLSNMNQKLKTAAIDCVNNLTDPAIRQSLLTHIENIQPVDSSSWAEYLDQLDNLRNTNWKKTLSRLYEIA
jgi:sulfatase maturation enzyme AslB (radical SAM superfamily)